MVEPSTQLGYEMFSVSIKSHGVNKCGVRTAHWLAFQGVRNAWSFLIAQIFQ